MPDTQGFSITLRLTIPDTASREVQSLHAMSVGSAIKDMREKDLTVRACFSIAAAMLEAASRLSPASIVSVLISALELKVRSFSSATYSETNSRSAC